MEKPLDSISIEPLIEKVEKLNANVPNKVIRDADTILADIMKKADHQCTGLAQEIFDIWKSSSDKSGIELLFYNLAGVKFRYYLNYCINHITRKTREELLDDLICLFTKDKKNHKLPIVKLPATMNNDILNALYQNKAYDIVYSTNIPNLIEGIKQQANNNPNKTYVILIEHINTVHDRITEIIQTIETVPENTSIIITYTPTAKDQEITKLFKHKEINIHEYNPDQEG